MFFTVKQNIAMMKASPDMFLSHIAPPKKLGLASESMLHILEVRNVCMCDSILLSVLQTEALMDVIHFIMRRT